MKQLEYVQGRPEAIGPTQMLITQVTQSLLYGSVESGDSNFPFTIIQTKMRFLFVLGILQSFRESHLRSNPFQGFFPSHML